MNENDIPVSENVEVQHPIGTTNIPPSPDLINDIGGFLPIILIILTILGSIAGFNFIKNTKKLKLDQKIKSSNHKENIKNVELNAKELDKITSTLIKSIVDNDEHIKKQSTDIQNAIDESVKDIQKINSKDQSISNTKNRLKNALDKLGENK